MNYSKHTCVLVLLTHGDLCGLYYVLYIHVYVFTPYKYKNCKNIYITQYQKIVKTTEMTPTMWHWFCREHAGKVIRHHLWHSLMDQRLRRLDWRFFLDIQLLLCWSLQKIYVIYEINLTFTHLNNKFTLCFKKHFQNNFLADSYFWSCFNIHGLGESLHGIIWDSGFWHGGGGSWRSRELGRHSRFRGRCSRNGLTQGGWFLRFDILGWRLVKRHHEVSISRTSMCGV